MRYIVLLITMVLLILSKYEKKYRKILIFLSASVLIIYASLRGIIFNGIYKGNDFESYRKWFYSIENVRISWNNDILFNLLFTVIKKYTNSFSVFIALSSCLLVYSIYKFSIDNSSNYIFTIFCFITFGIFELALSAIRQWIAASIFLLAFRYIKEKKFWRYFICILIAAAFHNSAIVLLAVYPFINSKFDIRIKCVIVIFFAALITVLTKNSTIINLIYEYVPSYKLKYINIGQELNSNYTVFIITSVCMLITLFYKKLLLYNDTESNNKICFLILLFFFSYIATLNPMYGRMLQYFMPAIPLIVPSIIGLINNKEQRLTLLCVVTVLFGLIFVF